MVSKKQLTCLAAVLLCSALLWMTFRPGRTSPLTVGLAGGWEEMSAELNQRVKARFPVGSAILQIEGDLEKQGFLRLDGPSLGVGPRPAAGETVRMRREDQFPCDQAAYVYWRADRNGRLTAIRGDYREEGCL